jgi:hypothetical protein
MKIIHIPKNVGGNPYLISKYSVNDVTKSEVWVLENNNYDYSANKFIFSKDDNFFLREFKKLLALNYIFKCDIVFYNYGTSLYSPFFTLDLDNYPSWKVPFIYIYCLYTRFMSWVELGLVKIRKVSIFIQYQGDDARQGDYQKENFKINIAKEVDKFYYSKKTDLMKRKQIKLFGRIAKKIYSLNPDLMHVLPINTEFLPYMIEDLNQIKPTFLNLDSKKLKIGHAPSNRSVKGTRYILDAVKKLQEEKLPFEFILIENLTHEEALNEYSKIDVLVDQLLAGWYGGLAVEVMSLGKPVVAYIREEDLDFIPKKMKEDIPIINSDPESIYSCLKKLIFMSKNELNIVALNSRKYVEKWHDPKKITDRISRDFLSI